MGFTIADAGFLCLCFFIGQDKLNKKIRHNVGTCLIFSFKYQVNIFLEVRKRTRLLKNISG